MKKSIARLAILASTALYAMSSHAVVESGHWSLTNITPTGNGGNVAISMDQTISGDYTGTILNYSSIGGNLGFVTLTVDEGSELFLAQAGSSFSNATAASPAFVSLFSTSTNPIHVGTDFYLAGRTRSMTDPGFSWSQPDFYTSFGWVHVKMDTQGKLQILDSAMAFREGGIVVGTTQAIPEPGTYLLMGLGLVGMAALRKTRKA